MKLMINASEPNYGVVEDFMIMDSEPVIGKWLFRAKAHNMVSIFIFFIITQLSKKFILLINVTMPIILGILTFSSMIY